MGMFYVSSFKGTHVKLLMPPAPCRPVPVPAQSQSRPSPLRTLPPGPKRQTRRPGLPPPTLSMPSRGLLIKKPYNNGHLRGNGDGQKFFIRKNLKKRIDKRKRFIIEYKKLVEAGGRLER